MRAPIIAFAAILIASASLHADDITEGEALVKKSDCLTCHQPAHKVVGPAYQDVAKKYKGQPGIVAKLVKKVKAGGSGVWGQVPMVPHPQLSDADLTKMVKWVLAGAPMTAPKAVPTAVPTAVKAEAAPAPAADDKGMPHRTKKKHHPIIAEEKGETLAWSNDAEIRDLMTKQDCFGCHNGSNALGDPEKKPWPSFKQIEGRFHGSGDVAALVKKVKDNEGKNQWGAIPHPTYPDLPNEAIDASIRYILAGKASQAPVAASTAEMGAEEWMKTRSDCFSCHQVTVKVVGPAYRDVAKKYTAKDIPMLVAKVKAGGSGHWGNVPMAPHTSVPDATIEKAVRWVLSQK